jgi:hypothetical protein
MRMVHWRRLLVVLGAGLAVAGLLLVYVPVPGQGVGSRMVPVGFGESITVTGNYAVFTSSIPFHVHWTSASPVHISILGCGTDPTCNATISAQPAPMPIANATGTAGTLTFTGLKGHSYLVVPNGSANATSVAVDYSLPWQGGAPGLGCIAGGLVLLLVAGLSRKRPPAPVAADAPT